MKKLLTTALILLSVQAIAQELEIREMYLAGNTVEVRYDLISADPDQLYKVEVYTSHDNYSGALASLDGAVGAGVRPGRGQSFTWNGYEDLGEYSGPISLELRAEEFDASVTFTRPRESATIKRGSTYAINWQGGSYINGKKVRIYRNDKLISTLDVRGTGESFEWKVPGDLKIGGGYSMAIFDPYSGLDTPLDKQAFRVKRRVSTFAKVGLLTLVGAGTFVATTLGGTEATGDSSIPDPPGPPAGN